MSSTSSSNLSIADRIAQLSINSQLDSAPTPIYTYIYIYAHSNEVAYKNYMEGAILLAQWLAPLDLTSAMEQYPEATNRNFQVHSLLTGYEAHQLANIIISYATLESQKKYTFQNVVNLIYFIMRRMILEMY